MAVTNWSALARSTGAVWSVGHGLQPVPPLERSRDLGSGVSRVAGPRRSPGQAGLGDPFCRWDHCARSPTCGRGKKSSPEAEAFVRSQGGRSTKVHVCAEGQGKPITFLLTPVSSMRLRRPKNSSAREPYAGPKADLVCVPTDNYLVSVANSGCRAALDASWAKSALFLPPTGLSSDGLLEAMDLPLGVASGLAVALALFASVFA